MVASTPSGFTPPRSGEGFYCGGNGVFNRATGVCDCHTAEWSGEFCQIHNRIYGLESGTQPIMWAFPFCMALPELDHRQVSKITYWICSEALTRHEDPHNNCHDIMHRTGIFQKYDAHAKSALSFTYWKNEMGKPCQDLRGYFDENGEFYYDVNGDQMAIESRWTGPAIWPEQEIRPLPTDICGPNQLCCIPRIRENAQQTFEHSVARQSIVLQRLCSPVYKLECDDGDIQCERNGYGPNRAECNCLKVNDESLLQYSGRGADCRRISPGGDLVYRDGIDLFQMIAYAATDVFKRTGKCEFWWASESDVVLCQNNASGTACQVQYQPGIHVDWAGYFAGGKP